MGLLSEYIAYKLGAASKRRRIERDLETIELYETERCADCGYERRQHSQDGKETCPRY